VVQGSSAHPHPGPLAEGVGERSDSTLALIFTSTPTRPRSCTTSSGDMWIAWNDKMKGMLLKAQAREGHEAGSFYDGSMAATAPTPAGASTARPSRQ
jgi:hypothetical protein